MNKNGTSFFINDDTKMLNKDYPISCFLFTALETNFYLFNL